MYIATTITRSHKPYNVLVPGSSYSHTGQGVWGFQLTFGRFMKNDGIGAKCIYIEHTTINYEDRRDEQGPGIAVAGWRVVFVVLGWVWPRAWLRVSGRLSWKRNLCQ